MEVHRSLPNVVRAPSADRRLAAAAGAALLGFLLILGVGFAGPQALHNAAHDARHGFSFPCH